MEGEFDSEIRANKRQHGVAAPLARQVSPPTCGTTEAAIGDKWQGGSKNLTGQRKQGSPHRRLAAQRGRRMTSQRRRGGRPKRGRCYSVSLERAGREVRIPRIEAGQCRVDVVDPSSATLESFEIENAKRFVMAMDGSISAEEAEEIAEQYILGEISRG